MSSKKESLKASDEIVLFGREVDDLDITDTAAGQLFARVYGFTYDGVYVELLTPVLFLVDGKGEDASKATVPGPDPRNAGFIASLRIWTVKRTDNTIRLDVDTGKFERVLLEAVGDAGGGAGGVSGARVSGARVSGARVSGARVSGARISGARISGARGDASD